MTLPVRFVRPRAVLAVLSTLVALAGCGGGGTKSIVAPVPPRESVAAVDVTPNVTTLAPGATATLSAAVRGSSGAALSGRVVTWSSSSPAVASVSVAGVVTGVAEGTTTVSATSEGQAGFATITVRTPVASVVLTPPAASLAQGATQLFSASARDAAGAPLTGRAVTWTSSNSQVASVSAAGLVTAVALGSAVISATIENITSSAALSVTPVAVATVTLSPSAFTALVGASQAVVATAKDAGGSVIAGRTITWSSSSAAIATVSSAGVVTGVGAGSATISASVDGVIGTSTATITAIPVASLTLSPSSASVVEGNVVALVATPRDANGAALTGRAVSWTSSAPSVATVNSTGGVTGVSAGATIITATVEGRSATAAISVRSASAEPVIVSTSLTAGDTTQRVVVVTGPGATVQPALLVKNAAGVTLPATAVRWTARDPSRATVSSTGLITGVQGGRTFVVAESNTNSAVSDSLLVFVPANSSGPLLRTASTAYRLVATDTFSITVQVEMRDGKLLSAADFEIAWPGSSASPYDPFTVTSVTTLRAGVVLSSLGADFSEAARVTFATTTPVGGTVALIRLNCRVRTRNAANQIVLTLNELVDSSLARLTTSASTFNPVVIIR